MKLMNAGILIGAAVVASPAFALTVAISDRVSRDRLEEVCAVFAGDFSKRWNGERHAYACAGLAHGVTVSCRKRSCQAEVPRPPDGNGNPTLRQVLTSDYAAPPKPRRVVRDHRAKPEVRDHRRKPEVRDHRDPPEVRDHRGD